MFREQLTNGSRRAAIESMIFSVVDASNSALDTVATTKAVVAVTSMHLGGDPLARNTDAVPRFRFRGGMKTGEIQWAQSELLGGGAYGKVHAGFNPVSGLSTP